MIAGIKDGKIKTIKIGNVFPSKGEIYYPNDWGTEDIVSFFKKSFVFKNKNKINDENPEEEFELLEITDVENWMDNSN